MSLMSKPAAVLDALKARHDKIENALKKLPLADEKRKALEKKIRDLIQRMHLEVMRLYKRIPFDAGQKLQEARRQAAKIAQKYLTEGETFVKMFGEDAAIDDAIKRLEKKAAETAARDPELFDDIDRGNPSESCFASSLKLADAIRQKKLAALKAKKKALEESARMKLAEELKKAKDEVARLKQAAFKAGEDAYNHADKLQHELAQELAKAKAKADQLQKEFEAHRAEIMAIYREIRSLVKDIEDMEKAVKSLVPG